MELKLSNFEVIRLRENTFGMLFSSSLYHSFISELSPVHELYVFDNYYHMNYNSLLIIINIIQFYNNINSFRIFF